MLEFRILHPELNYLLVPPHESSIPEGYEVMSMLCTQEDGRDVEFYNLVQRAAQMTETVVAHTEVVRDSYGNYMVLLHLTPEGRARFAELTGANIGRHLGIVFDGKLFSAPMVRDRIATDSAQITGQFTQREALELANILNNPLGLPATLTVELGELAVHSISVPAHPRRRLRQYPGRRRKCATASTTTASASSTKIRA